MNVLPTLSQVELEQREHFDKLADDFEAYYDDAWSHAYRDQFIYRKLFNNIPLGDKEVLEAMCGSGQTTYFLMQRGGRVTGLDISPELIRRFRNKWPQAHAVCASFLSSGLPSDAYDVVVVIGGLHHLHPFVSKAMDEVHRLLRPGGFFCFAEPHTGSLADIVRRWWYRRSALFQSNEGAIDLDALKRANSHRFSFVKEAYGGNFAFLFIYNALIFGIPLWLRAMIARPLIFLESFIQLFQTRATSAIVLGVWQKK